MKPTETALEFVDAVNHQHIDKMVGMMTPDHLFTDSLGNSIPGRRAMRDAWLGYFRMVPDYQIEVRETFVKGRVVLAVGTAGGTFVPEGSTSGEERFNIQAVWRAVVERDRISAWQVFADNEPLRALIQASQNAASSQEEGS